MKKSIVLLFLLAILGSTYYGLKSHFGMVAKFPSEFLHEKGIQKKLGALHPILEDQAFVAIIIGGNNQGSAARNLSSLLSQSYSNVRLIYIDNGSTDGTYEKVKELAQDKVEIIRCEKRKAPLEILYPLIQKCARHEIIALIEGKDWLAHENVFDHLNAVYANPNVWMTYSRAIHHPDYQKIEGAPFSDELLLNKKLRQKDKEMITPLITFYASFFQSIKLEDFLFEGDFIDDVYSLAIQLPLVEMGPEHLFFIDEVSYVKNDEDQKVDYQLHLQKVAIAQSYLRSLPSYPTLAQLPLGLAGSSHRYTSDVVIFSEDSPLHLYATLESLFANVQDLNDVYVLYKGSDHEFQRAYLNLQNEFHSAEFLNICDYPGNDYHALMTKVLSNKRHASPFLLFGTDRLVFEEKLCLHEAIAEMEKIHADYFLIAFEAGEEWAETKAVPLNGGIYAYQLGVKGAKQPFTLSLCRKNLFESLEGIDDLPSFKKLWQRKLQPHSVALFFEEKKTLPLDIPQETSMAQIKEWGHKFIEGFKIDLPSLICEMEEVEKGELPLIKRERRRQGKSSMED
jgi:glycosyltransferase involved in cell wall biosynthesis